MTTIGIDLGTTNSVCGVFRDGAVELIPNRLGEFLTPSVVSVDSDGHVFIGKVARDRMIKFPKGSAYAFKRQMGSDHTFLLNRDKYSSTELSAIVLKSLKEDAETFLGETIREAVVSVPAYFNNNQRKSTRIAAEIAGLKVNRLVNEPTAAAMAYGLHEQEEGLFLILDLGGGTFDVTILEYFDGVMEVHASGGDNFLGGEDFTMVLFEMFLRENRLNREDLTDLLIQQLYQKMENAKKLIEKKHSIQINLQLGEKSLDWALTLEKFESASTPLLLRAKRPIEQALLDCKLRATDINNVILVGGSTRLGVFRNMVGRLFKRLPTCNLDPDTVVAKGAAIQAALLAKDEALDDIVLTDVCPYTLGTGVLNVSDPTSDYFLPIIERNTTIPVSIEKTVCTTQDQQTTVKIGIYQGESRYVRSNAHLGSITVRVPRAPKGEESVGIRYSYDVSGILEVDCRVNSTGEIASKTIEYATEGLSDADREEAAQRLSRLKVHPREDERSLAIIVRAGRMYESALGELRDEIGTVLQEFDKILEKQNLKEIRRWQERIEILLDQWDTNPWI